MKHIWDEHDVIPGRFVSEYDNITNPHMIGQSQSKWFLINLYSGYTAVAHQFLSSKSLAEYLTVHNWKPIKKDI